MSVEKSKKLFEQSKKSLAGGVSSAARAKGPFPIFFDLIILVLFGIFILEKL